MEIIFGIVLLMMLPFICALICIINSRFILDYRFIYLISVGVWGGAKCLPIINDPYFGDYFNIDIFAYSIFIVSLIPFFFKCYTIKVNNNVEKIPTSRLLIFFILLLTIKLLLYFFGNYLTILTFVFNSLLNGMFLIIYGLLLMSIGKKQIILKILLISLLLISFNLQNINRTSLLLPLSFIILITYNGLNKYVVLMILISPIIFLMADILKQTGGNISNLNYSQYFSYIENNTYSPSFAIAFDYFTVLNNLNQSLDYLQFSLFKQLYGIFLPRIFFDEKITTSISSILWFEQLIPGPLYFEIFLEYYYDSGYFGIFIYNMVILYVVSILNRNLITFKNGNIKIFLFYTYILNLIVLFYITRGPFIMYIWYCLIPNVLCLFIILKQNLIRR